MQYSKMKAEPKHDSLVRALAQWYESKGFYVQADHIDHPHGSPSPIGKHTPDVAVYYAGRLSIICEVETCDSINKIGTYYQWRAFSQSPYCFEILVPKLCLNKAQRQAESWKINVSQWWHEV